VALDLVVVEEEGNVIPLLLLALGPVDQMVVDEEQLLVLEVMVQLQQDYHLVEVEVEVV
jgi:hypothetical protein